MGRCVGIGLAMLLVGGCCWCPANLSVAVDNQSDRAIELRYDHHESSYDHETDTQSSISVPMATRLPARSRAVIEVEQGGFDDSVRFEVVQDGCEIEVAVPEDDPAITLTAADFPCAMGVAN